MQERFDLRHKFLRQIFKLRAEARLHALSGPDQLFTECGQRGALATMGFDQGDAEKIGPLLDEIPDVAVGEVGMVRRTGKFPGLSDPASAANTARRRSIISPSRKPFG
jgi:hypothetical protein